MIMIALLFKGKRIIFSLTPGYRRYQACPDIIIRLYERKIVSFLFLALIQDGALYF